RGSVPAGLSRQRCAAWRCADPRGRCCRKRAAEFLAAFGIRRPDCAITIIRPADPGGWRVAILQDRSPAHIGAARFNRRGADMNYNRQDTSYSIAEDTIEVLNRLDVAPALYTGG